MFIVCISRHDIWLQTISCRPIWNVVVSANHSRLISHNYVVSSSMRRWGRELHSLLYRCIDETVTINNSETAEVQGEATARREQCGYIVHKLLHLDLNRSLWKEMAPQFTNTSPQVYIQHSRHANDHLGSASKNDRCFKYRLFFFYPEVTH